MSNALRVAHGVFGRVALLDMDRQLVRHAHPHCHVLLKVEGADTQFAIRQAIAPLTDTNAVLINAWEPHAYAHDARRPRTIILALFEGYWHRPEADAKALRCGWYFTGDTGYLDADGDLFVTGRVDDMILTGGENVSPVEIESCLSLHPAVSEVAVLGLADERWGKIVAAFIKRAAPITEVDLEEHCRTSGLANFKRPRRFVFVDQIPKSPVGKLLRRMLVAGEYQSESSPPGQMQEG